MKKIKPKLSAALLCIGLLLFGFFYHISASEFWPITISKTWWMLQNFEYSMLQKPLFTFFLSLFHLIPMSDSIHLYCVRLFFTLLGVLGLILFFKSFSTSKKYLWVGMLCFVFLSPVLLQNYFRIRSDQVGFFFFAVSLYLISKNKIAQAFASLFIVPFFGVKEIVFFIPGFILLYPYLTQRLKSLKFKECFYAVTTLIALLIWLVALNIGSISYFLQTFYSSVFPNFYLLNYLKLEWPLILSSFVCSFTLWFKNHPEGKIIFLSAFGGFALVLFLPQSYPFYIASLCLVIYRPLFVFFSERFFQKKYFTLALLLVFFQISNLVFNQITEKNLFYESNQSQFLYIQKTAALLEKYNLSYLDGMGLFPRQKFIPCFVSPDDFNANKSCFKRIKDQEAESVLVTQRLAYLETPVFQLIGEGYNQVRSDLWVTKKGKIQFSNDEMILDSELVPFFLFGN